MSVFYHTKKFLHNYPQTSIFGGILKCCLFFLILFAYSSVWSQLPVSGYVNGDYLIPTGIQSLNIEANGARGGIAAVGTCNYWGGDAVILKADFPVGNIECSGNVFVLKPGGKLRFVMGKNGQDKSARFDGESVHGGGGGGTAVLYQAPGSNTWTLLMVAGGGGGGYGTSELGSGNCIGNAGGNAQTVGNGGNGGGNFGGAGGSGGS